MAWLPPSKTLTVLIVDDDAPVRSLLRETIERAGFVVVGEAADGAQAVRLAERLRPDVVTMDLDMPVMDGAAAIEAITRNGGPRIIIVSGSQSSDLVLHALAAGAQWQIAKPDAVEQLPFILRSLLYTTKD